MRAAPMQTDINFSLAQLLWIIGGITAIAAFIKWLSAPFKKLDDHETRIKAVEENLAERRETDQLIMESLAAMMDHMIDGNGVEQLKEVRKKTRQQIIKHTK